MANKPNLDDYNTVAERMAEFFAKYPEGSFKSTCQLMEVGDRWAAIVKATAMRHPADAAPGDGHAIEFIPGATTFTKDSELQNAETAAWGRAVMAVGAADSKKGLASREEVRNRTAPRLASVPSDNREGQDALLALCQENGWETTEIAGIFQARMGVHPRIATNADLTSFVNLVKAGVLTPGRPPDEPVPA